MKRKKVVFLQDLQVWDDLGGAQKTDLGHIKFGMLDRGCDIDVLTPQSLNSRSVKDVDLLVLSNCVTFDNGKLMGLLKKFPYVVFHHDYNFCRNRLFFPQQEKCKVCLNKPIWSEIMKNAKLNIFLSPAHLEAYKFVFGNIDNAVYVPSPIDVSKFKAVEGVERKKNSVVGINCLLPFKGRYNIFNYCQEHPDWEFTFVGNNPRISSPNAKYVEFVPNEELPKFLSQFEYFIHIPEHQQPFERTAVEAVCCGCKLIVNDLVGATSYKWFDSEKNVRFHIEQSSIGFWESIEKVMKWGNWEV